MSGLTRSVMLSTPLYTCLRAVLSLFSSDCEEHTNIGTCAEHGNVLLQIGETDHLHSQPLPTFQLHRTMVNGL